MGLWDKIRQEFSEENGEEREMTDSEVTNDVEVDDSLKDVDSATPEQVNEETADFDEQPDAPAYEGDVDVLTDEELDAEDVEYDDDGSDFDDEDVDVEDDEDDD